MLTPPMQRTSVRRRPIEQIHTTKQLPGLKVHVDSEFGSDPVHAKQYY